MSESGLCFKQAESDSSPAAAGTSSFGMSGINAHAIFSAPVAALGTAESSLFTAESPSGLVWQRARHWPAPAAHRLLRSFAREATGGTCVFSTDLSAPNLAYLHDHQVWASGWQQSTLFLINY